MNSISSNSSDSPYITYKIENSLLISLYKRDLQIDIKIAKQIVQQRLSFLNGNHYLNLVDVSHIKSVSKEARDYLAKHDEGLIASAILGENSLSNMITNIFLTFSKPRIPARAFQDKETALQWLSQFNTEPFYEEPVYEFCKLDAIDLKVASWIFSTCPPRILFSYLEFIVKKNYERKGIKLSIKKIYDELVDVL